MVSFNYKNTKTKIRKGGKTMRKVTIKKGLKSVKKYHKGKKNFLQIKMGKFVPKLFSDFSKKTKRNKKGCKSYVQFTKKSSACQSGGVKEMKPQPRPPPLNSPAEIIYLFLNFLIMQNRERVARYRVIDTRLTEIENMTSEEREQHVQEEDDLRIEIDELYDQTEAFRPYYNHLYYAYFGRPPPQQARPA